MAERIIDNEIRLIPYYRNDAVSLPWYQDLDVCKQVDNRDEAYTAELLHRMYDFLSSHGKCYLAKVDGEIIGTASLNRKPRRMSHRGEFGISLKKAWWGCGAASALMEAILAFAKENGFEQLNLEVRSSNARAIHLYEKYGFRKLCTFPRFFKINGEYIDFDLMNLELNAEKDKTKGE